MNRKERGNGTGSAYLRGNTWTGQIIIGWKDNRIPIKKRKAGFQSKEEALAWCAKMMLPKQMEYKTISLEDFFRIRESRKTSGDIVGVYVLYNTRNKQLNFPITKRPRKRKAA